MLSNKYKVPSRIDSLIASHSFNEGILDRIMVKAIKEIEKWDRADFKLDSDDDSGTAKYVAVILFREQGWDAKIREVKVKDYYDHVYDYYLEIN